MCVAAHVELQKIQQLRLLNYFLVDKTTKKNIIWATNAYSNEFGSDYAKDQQIFPYLLTRAPFQLMFRAEKAREVQSQRTKSHAEVFTPFWVVKLMNDYVDEDWFGYKGVFDQEKIEFPKKKTWKKYVDNRRLEITCGEAPYLVTRYDVSNGDPIDLPNRTGLLDRKLRVISENAETEEEWLKWAVRAVQATYGFEFQGDNVLLARINVFATVNEYMRDRWGHDLDPKMARHIANIISWNIWQMDGLTGRVPYAVRYDWEQMTMGQWAMPETTEGEMECKIYDWRGRKQFTFNSMKER